MNPVYVTIVLWTLGMIIQIIFWYVASERRDKKEALLAARKASADAIALAEKSGQEDAKLELLREAHNDLVDQLETVRDVNLENSREIANIRGFLRGGSGAPINGGTH